MGRYAELNKDKNEILIQLFKNQEIARLMTIQNDPLSLTTPNISNIPSVLSPLIKDSYIVPISEETGCKLIILFTNLGGIGSVFKSCIIDITILVHQDWWTDNKGVTRAYLLADRIDSILTNNFKLSMGGLQSIGGRGYVEIANGNPFKGFNIQFKSVDFS